MAKESDMSLYSDVLEPFRRVINTEPPKDKLSASTNLNFSDSTQSIKEGIVRNNLLTINVSTFERHLVQCKFKFKKYI